VVVYVGHYAMARQWQRSRPRAVETGGRDSVAAIISGGGGEGGGGVGEGMGVTGPAPVAGSGSGPGSGQGQGPGTPYQHRQQQQHQQPYQHQQRQQHAPPPPMSQTLPLRSPARQPHARQTPQRGAPIPAASPWRGQPPGAARGSVSGLRPGVGGATAVLRHRPSPGPTGGPGVRRVAPGGGDAGVGARNAMAMSGYFPMPADPRRGLPGARAGATVGGRPWASTLGPHAYR
jgi:hypothetical protein